VLAVQLLNSMEQTNAEPQILLKNEAIVGHVCIIFVADIWMGGYASKQVLSYTSKQILSFRPRDTL